MRRSGSIPIRPERRLGAGGDLVAQRWVARWTFKGEVAGLGPNWKVIPRGGVSLFRLAGGRMEHYAYIGAAS